MVDFWNLICEPDFLDTRLYFSILSEIFVNIRREGTSGV